MKANVYAPIRPKLLRHVNRLSLALAMTASLAGAQEKRERRPNLAVELAAPQVELPLDHRNGHANIAVMLGDQGPFDFQFDTYCSIGATIDQALAKDLELPVIGQIPNSDGSKIVMRDVVWIGELSFGGVSLRNVQAMVDDYSFVPTPGGSLKGLIGFPALRSKLVTFDYPGNVLRVGEGELSAEDPGVLPFLLQTGCPDLHLEIGGEQVVVGIDTGSSSGLLLDTRVAERLGLTDSLITHGQAKTVYSTHDLMRGILPKSIDLAGYSIEPRTALFFDLPEVRGLLGYQILRSFAVTFDGKGKLVRFVRPPRPQGVSLSDSEASAWLGTYRYESTTYVIERHPGGLLFIEDELPGVGTIPLGPRELLLESVPIRLRLSADGKPALLVQVHPDQPARTARRLD